MCSRTTHISITCNYWTDFKWPINLLDLRLKLSLLFISVYTYTESGLLVGLLRGLQRSTLTSFTKQNRLYFTVNEFEKDMTKFDNLSFGNFRMIFKFFILFYSILLAVFMASPVVRKAYIFCQVQMRNRRRGARGGGGVSILRRVLSKIWTPNDVIWAV